MWNAIDDVQQRLIRAVDLDDRPLVIGCCKELVESIAKATISMRGDVVIEMDFTKLVSAAHKLLGRQPGPELADDPELRNLSQGLKSIVLQFGELRNRVGTGHGRTYAPEIQAEVTDVAVDAALLWSRWALARLSQLSLGRPESLIDDLNHANFTAGKLADRLQASNLADLDEDTQRRLGIAVGQRAMRETFLVRQEGVEACAASGDLMRWPDSYRRGVVLGLLIDRDGYATASAWSAPILVQLIESIPDKSFLEGVLGKVSKTGPRTRFVGLTHPGGGVDVVQGMRDAGRRLGAADSGSLWSELVAHFAPGEVTDGPTLNS